MREDVIIKDSYILMYAVDGNKSYALYTGNRDERNNAVKSYTLTGGVSEPFEVLMMKIPRNKLVQAASPLTKPNAMIEGTNKITLSAMGKGEYVFQSASLSDDTYTIKAYCAAYKITKTNSTVDIAGYPLEIITGILNGAYGGEKYVTGKIRYFCQRFPLSHNDTSHARDTLSFKTGVNIWYIIQVCALYLGCRVFFTGTDAYIVDYRLPKEVFLTNGVAYTTEKDAEGNSIIDAVYDFPDIKLHTTDASRPEYSRITGNVSLGSEGFDTVTNNVVIKCTNSQTGASDQVVDISDPISIGYSFRTVKNSTYTISELRETSLNDESVTDGVYYRQGTVVASNILDYRSEPQRSMRFKFKEYVNSNGQTHWLPYFPPSCRVSSIVDDIDSVTIDNKWWDTPAIKLQKLCLSSYTRNFPEGTSTYEFGVIKNISLPEKLSDMTTAQQHS